MIAEPADAALEERALRLDLRGGRLGRQVLHGDVPGVVDINHPGTTNVVVAVAFA